MPGGSVFQLIFSVLLFANIGNVFKRILFGIDNLFFAFDLPFGDLIKIREVCIGFKAVKYLSNVRLVSVRQELLVYTSATEYKYRLFRRL